MYVRIHVTFRRVQHAMRRHHIDVYSLSCLNVFFRIVSYTHDLRNKKKVMEHKMFVLIFSTCFV